MPSSKKSRTAKKFPRFMELPLELRIMILGEFAGGEFDLASVEQAKACGFDLDRKVQRHFVAPLLASSEVKWIVEEVRRRPGVGA